jgi:hypothetical protein
MKRVLAQKQSCLKDKEVIIIAKDKKIITSMIGVKEKVLWFK